jgi:hypothetical protein
MELVRLSGVATPRITVLAGMRPHGGLDRDGALDELLATDGRFAPAEGWRVPSGLARTAKLLGQQVDQLVAAQIAVPSETDLARLLMVKQWPGLRLSEVRLADDPGVPNELGVRSVAVEVYTRPEIERDFWLLNGASVDRNDTGADRPPRPTSVSTTREWAQLCLTGEEREILVVVNQPHLVRVHEAVVKVLDEVGLGDVAVDVAGCEVFRKAAQLPLILGEIPARINAGRERS